MSTRGLWFQSAVDLFQSLKQQLLTDNHIVVKLTSTYASHH